MRCPFCASENTQVKDSRAAEDGAAIRRRRQCADCGQRFTTFERVQLRELVVRKRSGRTVLFDREKLLRSVDLATRKRPVQPEQLDKVVSAIVRQLESSGDAEITSDQIGRHVMEALAGLDPVAYVRYASVYKDFQRVEDFTKFLSAENLRDDDADMDGAKAREGRGA